MNAKLLAALAVMAATAISQAACSGKTIESLEGTASPFSGIPLPAFEAAGGRTSSSMDFFLLGENYNTQLAANRATAGPGTALTLAPNFGPAPGGSGFEDMAFAIYSFQCGANFPSGGHLATSFLPAVQGLSWVGVSDYRINAWRWFELGADGKVDLPDLNNYFDGGDFVHCAIVQLGVSNDAVVEWVKLGPPTPEVEASYAPVPVEITNSDGASNLLMVGDNPAFAARINDGSASVVAFIRASDPDGLAWDSPIPVGDGSWGTPALADVGGMPACAYGGSQPGVAFCRATDASGSSWGEPVYVHPTGGWSEGALFMVNGRPAIAFVSFDNSVCYIRANDATGTSWPAAAEVLHGPNIDYRYSHLAARVIGGVPQIAAEWVDLTAQELRVIHLSSSDADGTSWNAETAPFMTAHDANGIHNLNLLELDNGIPGVGWFLEDYNTPLNNTGYFAVAQDAAGSAWGTPEPVFTGYAEAPFPLIVKYAAYDVLTIEEAPYLVSSGITLNSIGMQRAEVLVWPISAAGSIDFNGLRGHAHINFAPAAGPAAAGKEPHAIKGVSTYESWSDLESMMITNPFGYIIMYVLCFGYKPDFTGQTLMSRPIPFPYLEYLEWAMGD